METTCVASPTAREQRCRCCLGDGAEVCLAQLWRLVAGTRALDLACLHFQIFTISLRYSLSEGISWSVEEVSILSTCTEAGPQLVTMVAAVIIELKAMTRDTRRNETRSSEAAR